MIDWSEPLIDNSLRGTDERLIARLHEMDPEQLRRFACAAAQLALERAPLDEPAIHRALAVARTIGTQAAPPEEELTALREVVERRFRALDEIGFDLHDAHEAGLGPTYEDYLQATHKACAAESVLYALAADPREAAVIAMSVAEWKTPPRVEFDDFLRAADEALGIHRVQ